jgi:hypothetical protein
MKEFKKKIRHHRSRHSRSVKVRAFARSAVAFIWRSKSYKIIIWPVQLQLSKKRKISTKLTAVKRNIEKK